MEAVEIIERRRQVFTYKMLGLKNEDIANKLSVSLSTVEKDSKWLKENAAEKIANFDQKIDKGLTLKRLEQIMKMYWHKYYEARPGTEVNQDTGKLIKEGDEKRQAYYLREIRILESEIISAKVAAGLWQKPKQEIDPFDEETFESKVIKWRQEENDKYNTPQALPEPAEKKKSLFDEYTTGKKAKKKIKKR